MNEQMLTIAEAARRLGVGHQLVRRLVNEGTLRGIHVGRLVRVPESELKTFIRAQQERGAVRGA